MSTLTGSVYGWLSEQTGNQMEIDRRSFLTGGLACAGLAVLPGKYPVADLVSTDDLAAIFGLHSFTVSLLERVARARSAVDRSKVERFIRQRAEYLGHRLPPVIKWLPGPQAAFDHLSRHGFGTGDAKFTFSELEEKCALEFADIFVGAVFFSQTNAKWERQLLGLLKKVLEQRE
jgi:hypothetical protein